MGFKYYKYNFQKKLQGSHLFTPERNIRLTKDGYISIYTIENTTDVFCNFYTDMDVRTSQSGTYILKRDKCKYATSRITLSLYSNIGNKVDIL